MKRLKVDKGLLDKKRFAELEEEKKRWLRNLSLKKAIKLEENLLSSSLIWEWRKNFSKDEPVCLRDTLKKKR